MIYELSHISLYMLQTVLYHRADMSQPLISVIVPVYKVEKWVETCVRSICAQSYRHLEIICVDDGSPDRSGAILDSLAAEDDRIKVIHQPNQGLSAARNAGLAVASGEWVTGVDGDDALAPGIYEAAVSHLTEAVDVLLFGTQYTDEEGKRIGKPNGGYFALPEEGHYPITPEWVMSWNVCFWNKLWRRSVIERHHLCFPVGMLHEDEGFCRLFYPYAKGKMYVLPMAGYLYLQRQNSIMADKNAAQRVTAARRILELTDWVKAEYVRRGMGDAHWEYMMSLLWSATEGVTPEDGELCRRIWQIATECDRRVSRQQDYRLSYWSALMHGKLRSPLRRMTRSYLQYTIMGVPLVRLCYQHGRYHHFETIFRLVARAVKNSLCRASA